MIDFTPKTGLLRREGPGWGFEKTGAVFPPAQSRHLYIGVDIGSTTVKAIVLDEQDRPVFSQYTRHFSDARNCLLALLRKMGDCAGSAICHLGITGSGSISLARELDFPFIQEVLSSSLAISKRYPDADVAIELGGEDAKLTYLTGGLEQRMNETCAGGTGAFIDQMAAFLATSASGLNALALNGKTIYPIASRCGVFARSDILPLLNEGCRREDIALSIMQAVVNQTISGLAQGRPIKGRVVFLGGPLHFLSALRQRFIASLPRMDAGIFPDDGHFFVALGAALHSREVEAPPFSFARAIASIRNVADADSRRVLPPLFSTREAREDFYTRHGAHPPGKASLETAVGNAWLGLDCGSTTLKAVLLDDAARLLYSWYAPSKGDPLKTALHVLGEIYSRKNPALTIRGSCATGYGSALLAAALRLDFDEVETVSHFAAARHFEPNVTFILDIGGQDIKCMHVKNGFINHISLNEACSAGCGAFIENFAESLGVSLPEFVAASLEAKAPVDLGSRCTVFMNSRVKQAQKEGASLNDIAAGLAYSVVRNAIFKVIKIANPEKLGAHVVVQGGAFLNDALLRALELELGVSVTRPPYPGLMGAFGAALVARDRSNGKSSLLSQAELKTFQARNKTARCSRCANACLLTVTKFANGGKYVSGNRCERGAGASSGELPNLFAWKYKRLFSHYTPLTPENAWRGSIGIPRTLNMYEDFPLWFTLFTHLGFRVEISPESSKKLFHKSFDTIPSQTVCYPAKLAHGHVLALVDMGIDTIFYPCVQKEQKKSFHAGRFNCPVVASYPELLACNMDILRERKIRFIHDFLPLDRNLLAKKLGDVPFFSSIPEMEIEEAVQAGFQELDNYHGDVRKAGEDVLEYLGGSGEMGLVLAGHPYHIDPEVHHGIAELVNSCGLAALTEDSIAHLAPDAGPLRALNQWAYHSRLYQAGSFAAGLDNIAVLQLVSFGCGLDAITSDQLEEILARKGRLYAQIKIDEGSSLGGARIRIRSLLAAMREAKRKDKKAKPEPAVGNASREEEFPAFTPEMKKTHVILFPQMSPMHFQFAREIFGHDGYNVELLPHVSRKALETGQKYVHNDACFPAIMVIGQLLDAVRSGKYDDKKIALGISQTGGACRASNYVAFLRKALRDAGYAHVPVAAFSTTIHAPGIRMSRKMLRAFIMAAHYGDALNRIVHRLRPYEPEKGLVDYMAEKWSAKAASNIGNGGIIHFQRNIAAMIGEFDKMPLASEKRRPRFGLVGEILLKYHPDANNNAARIIEEEGGEAVITDAANFLLYTTYNHIFNLRRLDGSIKQARKARLAIAFLEATRYFMRLCFQASKRFDRPDSIQELVKSASGIISLGHQAGEGWLLCGEMARMIESGVAGILCMQPFGCLPNHMVGKGIIRELKRRYPDAAITPVDYDPGTSEVNQINRIKLLMRAVK